MSEAKNVGILIFEDMTMLDGYAPMQMLSFVEQFKTFTFAKTSAPLRSDCGAMLTPDYSFDTCPEPDILIVPGGGNVLPQMTDSVTQDFLKAAAARAQYVTSVCTGALILAEAGLLDGFRATTHWGWIDSLAAYEKINVVDERVVVDRNRITGGGITAGIDFALTLIAEVVAPPAAQAMQLIFEYRPEPPFDSGSPTSAPPEILAMVKQQIAQQSGELFQYIRSKSP
jgi:transcriptional regulator GlxA family with amidase domain